MAISTYKTYLMMKESSTYTKLIDIKDFGDLGGEPEILPTTTLSDGVQTNILGIQSLDAITFTCNYTKADYAKLNALVGEQKDFAVWFGASNAGAPDGSDGKFEFKGALSVYVNGGSVNEVVDMTISIAPSTVITFAQG